MQEYIHIFIVAYLAFISFFAIGMTLYDKRAARKGSWRVKEQTLLFVSILGGSVVMFFTMCGIRHKTKHSKFMVGIPIIIILQIAAVVFVLILKKARI